MEAREWMQKEEVKMTSEWMAQSMVENIDEMFKHWKPKKEYKMFIGSPISKNTNAGSYNPIKKIWE